MLFWFAGVSFVAVALVFASPAIDYRLVMAGAIAPVFELGWGPPWLLHTLLAPVTTMTLTMIILRGRRLAQRRWLGLSIGLFMHLVLDGTWRHASLFWWPGFGASVHAGDEPNLFAMPWLAVAELVGLLALTWAIWRFGLSEPSRRRLFLRTGQLDRSALVTTRRG